jgi:isoleucyl-tRNA synthetase
MFPKLPDKPDHPALEEEILAWWDAEEIFQQLRDQTAGGPKWSFVDGPITANNPMGVHHAWGRALKDVFQRYKALRGFDLRYQNGFDSQGLWVEVEVERSLGLGSKREIEDYGLAEFAQRCKERVAQFGAVITEQSRRLGMWMDWDNSYYTFSDTNIEYIWRFLKECHARGWIYKGHRATQWCPRCGTSLSQHEQAGEDKYVELAHPSLYVRFPLRDRPGESLAIWTTTPWTLPANVAAAVKPDGEYVLVDGAWWLRERQPDATPERVARGEELVGLEYKGPFDDLPAQEGVVHRVIPWDAVATNEGTGIVHIAPGAGAEDFELSRVFDLPVLVPIDEAGKLLPEYGELATLTTDEVAAPVTQSLQERRLLIAYDAITHRYPICWRCSTPLVFRVVDDWFISCTEIRQPLLDANATVEWTPSFYSKRMDDWLRNMGDWNISRKRYFGLPLPFYPCECGALNVVGSKRELEQRAVAPIEDLPELHRPWIDAVEIACEACGKPVQRIPEVGDAWLDAGIVPFSTLGWQNPEWIEHGYATGASANVSGADLPDHAYWEEWFPADWVSESREQIRLWFYSQCFMGVTLDGRNPYRRVLTYERVRDETGREMHKSWGNAIEANEAFERMGADIVRWLFSEQIPSQNVNFGYGPAAEIKRRLLTLWNSVKFFVDYANIVDFVPGAGRGDAQTLDRWLEARTQQLVAEATDAYERFWTPDVIRAFESFVDDLSNWYIRRSRRRFWDGEAAALQALWSALVDSVRVISPIMPFFAEHLWRVIRADDATQSVFLTGWPEVHEPDASLLGEVAEVRAIVELGRQARAEAGLKLRQPLRRITVAGASYAQEHVEELKEELRAKDVQFDSGPVVRFTYKPNLPVLGPKLGRELPAVRSALAAGEFEYLDSGLIRVSGHDLSPETDLIAEPASERGWAHDGAYSVGIDLELDDELILEGRVFDLIHLVNTKRKEAGLELTDRITLTLPEGDADLLAHEQWIKDEVLAVEVRADGVAEPEIAKV